MKAEGFVYFDHSCIPSPAHSRSSVHICCMNEGTNELTSSDSAARPNASAMWRFSPSSGHQTMENLLPGFQARLSPRRKHGKTSPSPTLSQGHKLTSDLWWPSGFSAPARAAFTTVSGGNFQTTPKRYCYFKVGRTTDSSGFGVFVAGGASLWSPHSNYRRRPCASST